MPSEKIIARVVKADWMRPTGTWVLVSPELYARHSPNGTGHLAAPKRKHPGVPDVDDVEVVRAPAPLVQVTPEARELADAEEVELGLVRGTGQNGRILKGDVEHVIRARED